jgi:hypothetical protein
MEGRAMCWGMTASVAMVAAGGAAAAVSARRGDPVAIPGTLVFFALMEALQVAGYATIDQCGTPANRAVTQASYLHIVLQPLFINAFAMAIAPAPVAPALRRAVYALAALASLALLLRLAPLGWVGPCLPGTALCGEAWCTRAGEWHIAWDMPLNAGLPGALGWPVEFPAYFLAVFVLPLAYGAWRFVAFLAVFGPVLAMALTDDPNEMPAIWCLFSVGLALIALSPAIRRRALRARPA